MPASTDDAGERSVRRLQTTVSRWIGGVAADLEWDWLFWVWRTTLLAALIVAVLHAVQQWTLSGAGLWLALLSTTFSISLALMGLAVLIWALWRTSLDPRDDRPLAASLVAVVLTTTISIVASAGALALLETRATEVTVERTRISLWDAEKYFTWHVLDTIPLLEIPETLGWDRPSIPANSVAPVLVLILKVLLVLPIVQLLISGFRHFEAGRLERIQKQQARLERHASHVDTAWSMGPYADGRMSQLLIPAFIVLIGIGLGTSLTYLFEPRREPSVWVSDVIPDMWTVGEWSISLSWLQSVHEFLILIVVVLLSGAIMFWLRWHHPIPAVPTLLAVTSGIVRVLAMVGVASLLFAGLLLALAHAQIITVGPLVPDRHVYSAVSTTTWHLASLVPFVEVPDTFGWMIPWTTLDIWSRSILLLLRVAASTFAFILVSQLVGTLIHEKKRTPIETAMADIPLRFSTALKKRFEHQRGVQRLLSRNIDPLMLGPATWDHIEDDLVAVQQVFGLGEATSAAARAVWAVENHSHVLSAYRSQKRFTTPFRSSRYVPVISLEELEKAEKEAKAAIGRYVSEAGEALQRQISAIVAD